MKDGPLYGRYTITHKDGKPIDPNKRYFVLSPDSDPHARAALAAYITGCRATHPVLARSLAEEYGIAPENGWAGTIYDTAPMTAPDRLTLPAANSDYYLDLTIPMTDPETGEARTAVVTIDKRRLWRTEQGRVVRGVTVRWAAALGKAGEG